MVFVPIFACRGLTADLLAATYLLDVLIIERPSLFYTWMLGYALAILALAWITLTISVRDILRLMAWTREINRSKKPVKRELN